MNTEINIVGFDPSLKSHFSDLNLAWIKKYFKVESRDEEVLLNPEKHIIDKGGYIFFAKVNNRVAGTAALMKTSEDIYELAKMAVSEEYQGMKIGNELLNSCITKAKEIHAGKIILYSNTILGPALHLYKKYGFIKVPLENSEYNRSNIKMQLDIIK